MNTQTRYEYSPGIGLQVQRRDSDICDCEVAGYGPGATIEDARTFVARERGVLRVYGATATPAELTVAELVQRAMDVIRQRLPPLLLAAAAEVDGDRRVVLERAADECRACKSLTAFSATAAAVEGVYRGHGALVGAGFVAANAVLTAERVADNLSAMGTTPIPWSRSMYAANAMHQLKELALFPKEWGE